MDIISDVKEKLRVLSPECIKSLIYDAYLIRKNVKRNDILILATLTKSGTHFLRLLLSNYFALTLNPKQKGVKPKEMNDIFPNSWRSYFGIKPWYLPKLNLNKFGLFDMPRIHSEKKNLWEGSYVLHTYRNPYDFATFSYFYKFKILGIKKYTSPPELLDDNINEFVNCYKSFFKNQNHRLNLLSIAYEDLYQNPDLILRIIISWLGIDYNQIAFNKSITETFKQKETIYGGGEKWFWNGNNNLIVDKEFKYFQNIIYNSGPIGVWKHFFSDKQKKYFDKKFKQNNVNLRAFKYE